MVTMLIGFSGGLAVLMSFAGVACGRVSAHSGTYHAINVTGALAMVAAGVPADAWPSVGVNGTWALISAHGLARALAPPRAVREPLTDEHRPSGMTQRDLQVHRTFGSGAGDPVLATAGARTVWPEIDLPANCAWSSSASCGVPHAATSKSSDASFSSATPDDTDGLTHSGPI